MLLALELVPPVLTFLISILGLVLVFKQFHSKPIRLVFWLYLTFIAFLSWSLMILYYRTASSYSESLFLVSFSFIFVQLAMYGTFRFHRNFFVNKHFKNLDLYIVTALVALNSFLGFDHRYLSTIKLNNGLYTDNFNPILLIPHFVVVIISGYTTIMALKQMSLFGTTLEGENRKNDYKSIIAAVILSSFVLLIIPWLVVANQTKTNNTDIFILFSSIIVSFFIYIYGIRPFAKFFTPQRIWQILVIDSAGIPVYQRVFNEEESIADPLLISASLAVVGKFLPKKIKLTPIEEIKFSEKSITLLQKNGLSYCMISDNKSLQSQLLLTELSSTFSEISLSLKDTYDELYSSYNAALMKIIS